MVMYSQCSDSDRWCIQAFNMWFGKGGWVRLIAKKRLSRMLTGIVNIAAGFYIMRKHLHCRFILDMWVY